MRYTPKDIDTTICNLEDSARPGDREVAKMLNELQACLRQQEYRLHVIEEAVDGVSIIEHGRYTVTIEELLERIQQACPWDDDNEAGDSWFFTEEETMRTSYP